MIQHMAHDSKTVEQADISEVGVIASWDTESGYQQGQQNLFGLNIEATADASYALDVGLDEETLFSDEAVYDQADVDDPQDIRDSFEIVDRYVELRVTEPAAAGETATVTFQRK